MRTVIAIALLAVLPLWAASQEPAAEKKAEKA